MNARLCRANNVYTSSYKHGAAGCAKPHPLNNRSLATGAVV